MGILLVNKPINAHTKAPWQVLPQETDIPYLRVRGTVPGRRYKIANVHIPETDEFYTKQMIAWGLEESIANANLIAAAPELLEALKEMVNSYELEASPENPALLQAKAIIAKAEGNQC
jgi:hypothetical protein